MLTSRLITATDELAALEGPWNALSAGVPLRSWTWHATWWKHYRTLAEGPGRGADRALHVIAVYDDAPPAAPRLVGLAPWYLERTAVRGNVIRPLGSGQVCTDHLSLLAEPDHQPAVAGAVAGYLTAHHDNWDCLELPAVDAGDPAVGQLTAELEASDCLLWQRAAGNCWVADLAPTWEEYFAGLSKSHRKQLRQWHNRYVESGRAVCHLVKHVDELEQGWNVLVDLHQRRRQKLGEPGCFASRAFYDFHREMVALLLAAGKLRMSWVDLDGSPIAAEYHFVGANTVYTYQSGIDPERLEDSPGRLAHLLTIRRAVEEGFRRIDFLRGDEPYKAHWRAAPQPICDWRVFPNRRLARLQGHVMSAALAVKGWMKQGVELVTS